MCIHSHLIGQISLQGRVYHAHFTGEEETEPKNGFPISQPGGCKNVKLGLEQRLRRKWAGKRVPRDSGGIHGKGKGNVKMVIRPHLPEFCRPLRQVKKLLFQTTCLA